MKQFWPMAKNILIRSIGLFMATFFGGTAIGALAGDALMGSLVGVGAAFAIVIMQIGVSVTWTGALSHQAVENAFRSAVAKAAEDNEELKKALAIEEDGKYDFDDIEFEDNDDELYKK